MATLYILHSTNLDKFYIGHTEGTMEERLKKHLANHKGFTSKTKDWKVVYREEYSTKKEAYQRELQIKSWKSSKRIKELIDRHNSAGSEHPDL